MSCKIKLLLSKNDGDWRRRSAIIFKPNTTLTFNQFSKQCAQKLYPNESITNSTSIKLYDITHAQNGLIQIDDNKDTPLSELEHDNEIYRNCQILVILPSIHKLGIINPSKQQKNELKEEQELLSCLSNTNTSTSYTPSSNRSLHTLLSIHQLNQHTMQRTRSYDETPLILSRNNVMKQPCATVSPFQLTQIAPNTVTNVEKSPLVIANRANNTCTIPKIIDDTLQNKDKDIDIDSDDNMDELVCTLRNEDDDIDKNKKKLENTNNNKRARRDFKPSINNKRAKKKRKKKHKNDVDIYDNNNKKQNGFDDDKKRKKKAKKRRRNKEDINGIITMPDNGSIQKNGNVPPKKKRKLTDKQRVKTNGKQEMDDDDDDVEGDNLMDVEIKNDGNDETDGNGSCEYEEIVEYMMIEMKVGNTDSFNLHQYDKCVLTNMFNDNMLQSIKLQSRMGDAEDEYQGVYCETLGSHLFFKQNNVSNNNNNRNGNVRNDDKVLEYVDKTDAKCVFSRFKPRFYSS